MIVPAWYRQPAAAAAIFLAVCLVMIVLRPLLPIDETRYLAVAWEMWNSGSYIVPHLNGETYSHKPPLLFWLINLVWSAVGPSELAARLVAPTAGALAILLTGRLSLSLWPDDRARAGLSAWGLAGGGVFLLYGSTTMFDTLLAVSVILAVTSLWSLGQGRAMPATAALGAALALGILAKGPVMLLHVLPVVASYPLWRSGSSAPPSRRFLFSVGAALMIAALLVAIWLVPALASGGADYRHDILWRQSAGRMVESFAHQRPFWFFILLLPLFLWPWGWGREAAALWSRPVESQRRFLLAWAGGALLAFSLISGKQIHYLIPALPALALLLSGRARARIGTLERLVPLAPALFLIVAAVAIMVTMHVPDWMDGTTMSPVGVAVAAVLVGVTALQVCLVRSRLAARAYAAPVSLIALHLIAFEALWATSDSSRVASLLSTFAKHGVATTDERYAGQHSFLARLPDPVKVLRSAQELDLWMSSHPEGLLLTRQETADPTLELLRQDRLQGDLWFTYRVVEYHD